MFDKKEMEKDLDFQEAHRKERESRMKEYAASALYATSLFLFYLEIKDIAFDLYETIRHTNLSNEIPGSDGPAYGIMFLSALCLAAGGIMKAQARSDSNRSTIEFIYKMNRRRY